jgi:hypothetical protein
VRAVHTAVYVVMAFATFVVLYGGVTGAHGAWLWTALALVAAESVVFVGNGFRCPSTALAARYGGGGAAASDTYFPERLTRHTFQVFGPLIVVGVTLVAARQLGALK